jgi:hypothetical protein
MMNWHGLSLHEERFEQNAAQLKGLILDYLYKDEEIVSNDFKEGNIS